MPRRVIVKPLKEIDVTRMILNARKHLYEKEFAVNQTSFGLGWPNRRIIDQTDALLIIDETFHNQFRNSAPYWKLKLSAVLFFRVLYSVIKEDDRQILIDTEFDAKNQRRVTRYLKKLFSIHSVSRLYIDPVIEYRTDADYYINTVDIKTKRSRKGHFYPYIKLDATALLSVISKDFEIVSKISEKLL